MTLPARCRLAILAWTVVVPGAAAQRDRVPAPTSESVRWDWYFRQSLTAIRHWEAVLERLEGQSAERPTVPVLPVPHDGSWAVFPNPIPKALLPPEDRSERVRFRLVENQIEINRARGRGEYLRESVPLEQEIVGYLHPGSGGKDQWYHRYQRRFDRLLRFRAEPAPFSITMDTPLDLALGQNELTIRVRNVADEGLRVEGQLAFHGCQVSASAPPQSIQLAPKEEGALRFQFALEDQGGGVAVLSLEAGGQLFWLPIMTHVEEVTAVFESIEQILLDAPDPVAANRLATLKGRATAVQTPGRDGWRSLFEDASRLRDELLLRRVGLDRLLFVKRMPYFSEQPFMDAHHLFNRPGGGIYRLTPVRPDGRVAPVVDWLGEGVYRDVCLHWSADRMLFAFGNGSDQWDGSQSYDIYEVNVDGTELRRLTKGPYNDCEPFYFPDGRIGFTSDRSEHYVMCGGNRHSPTLFMAESDGSGVRQLSFNVFNDFNPTMLPDGRILYSRWEYNERSVTSLHNPFTMNPDGTMVSPYYGNATIRPNVVMFPRPVPQSHKVMALFTAHHGQTHGAIGLIDIRRGRDGKKPLELLTPNVPLMGEKAEDTAYGWYSDPVPLGESTYLCSYTPTVVPWLERSWALYVGDRHGNLALVLRDPEISCAEPVPLVTRSHPHVRPSGPPATDAADAEARLALVDVYRGLEGVPRGEAKYLRILEDVPRKSVRQGGVVLTSGTLIFTIKRIVGTVPIEADGSAYFVVPANRNVYFEVLDEEHQEIQRMRSVVCLKPGENRTCIGCHEHRNTAPPNDPLDALARESSRAEPAPWGTQTISFLRDVQPVLNAKCIQCHAYDRFAAGVILTDDLTDQFTISYEELLPYLSVAISNRWDHPDDVVPRPPYTFGSKVSRLMALLESGHHGVELSEDQRLRLVNWIDANAVYYDRYESDAYGPKRSIFSGPIAKEMHEVQKRRCAPCHGSADGRHDTWWLSVNRHDVKLSRAAAAPLARSAGGWQRCGDPIFADTDDGDYQRLLGALVSLRDRLAQRPREDLLSIAGTDAERQLVTLPPPPPPRRTAAAQLPPGEWVFLSDIPWESADSGWTRNQDGLPRRDRDVQDQMLRLDGRRFPKGIGTHAPSEILYRLDGRYDRFYAIVGGAEERGTVTFRVLGDDKMLFQSGLMQGLCSVKEVDVSVAGVRQLQLVVTDGGDNYYSDMANWAGARLRKDDGEK